MARVTVISPYFNRAVVVERTVKSILNQSYADLRAIIWDDYSPDRTWEELQRVSSELSDERLHVFRNPENVGLTRSLNNVFEMTDSEYVAIVGSGDVCHPERIKRQVQALDNDPNAVFCATGSVSIDELTGSRFLDDGFDGENIRLEDVAHVVPFTHGSVMYRRNKVLEAGLFEPTFKWCADWDLFMRILSLGNGIYLKDALYERYALMDGVSFHPVKSMEQIQYKYLAKHLSTISVADRPKVLVLARQDLDLCLGSYKEVMARDLWKRQIKLTFMGRFPQAEELGCLIEAKYGFSFVRFFGSRVARLLKCIPVSTDTLVSVTRRLSASR